MYQPMDVSDLAPMLADGVEDEDRGGETYEVAGPEVITLAELTRLVYRSRGKSIRIVPVPTFLAKVGLRIAEYVPFAPLGADQGASLDTDLVVENNDVEAFDVDPDEMRRIEDFLGVEGGQNRTVAPRS